MADGTITVTVSPAAQVASAGDTVVLTATVTGGGADATYAWKHDGQAVAGETGSALTLSPVAAGDTGAYTVTATSGSSSATSPAAVLAVRGEAPLEWDGTFAGNVLVAGIFLLLGLSWPLFWGLGTVLHQRSFPKNYPTLIAIEFLLIGIALVLATLFITLIELRGRARKPPVAAKDGTSDLATRLVLTLRSQPLTERTGEQLDAFETLLCLSAPDDHPLVRVFAANDKRVSEYTPEELESTNLTAVTVALGLTDTAPSGAAPTPESWVSVVAGAAPDTIKAWGSLKVSAALLLAALGLFAGGATLAWRSLGGSPAHGTTSTSTTTTTPTSTGQTTTAP